MADQNNGPLDISLDLNNTVTAIPMVADGHLCEWRLKNVTQSTNDKGKVLKWEYDLVAPAPSTQGTEIRPGDMGSKLFENIQLYAKPEAKDQKWYEKKISSRLDALLGTGDPDNAKGKPTRPALNAELIPQILGKTLLAKVAVRTGDGGYTGNEFKTVMFPGDVAA